MSDEETMPQINYLVLCIISVIGGCVGVHVLVHKCI